MQATHMKACVPERPRVEVDRQVMKLKHQTDGLSVYLFPFRYENCI